MNQSSRKKTRRYLVQCLYARIYGEVEMNRFSASYYDGILDFDVDQKYLTDMVDLVVEHQFDILGIIEIFAPKFDIATMLKTNILAIAISITEMLWLEEEIPAKVSLNEAIEIAKYYGDDTSKSIVNGILNSLLENIDEYKDFVAKDTHRVTFFS